MPKSRKPRLIRPPVRSWQERNALITANMSLCGWAVNRFYAANPARRIHLPFDDAMSCAMRGLWRACELWEPSKGTFGAYANVWMLQRLLRGLRETRLIHHPEGVQQRVKVIGLSDIEICDGEREFEPADHRGIDEARQARIEAVRQALARLHPRYRTVLELRASGLKQREVAERMGGVSRERVRQLERKAMDKLDDWLPDLGEM